MDKKKYIAISIIARRLGVTTQCVRDAIHCQELKGVNRGLGKKLPRWYVLESDFQEYIRKRENKIN